MVICAGERRRVDRFIEGHDDGVARGVAPTNCGPGPPTPLGVTVKVPVKMSREPRR